MRDETKTATEYVSSPRQSVGLIVGVVVAILAALGGLVWAYQLQGRLAATEAKLAAAEQGSSVFSKQLAAADAQMRENNANLTDQLTKAQQQQQALAARNSSLAARQIADTHRLEKTQAAAEEKIGAVQTDVSSVKTDVGSVRTDVASTRTDLADTKTLLQRTIGDAGVMSGLIARNHDELEVLKHRGDRSYFEFTLHKNAQPTLLATVKLQLKKTNEKKSKYNLLVSADDKNIEKKDKTLLEPVQFYTGKDPVLYEIVVNNVGKDVVSGYLSTPKGS